MPPTWLPFPRFDLPLVAFKRTMLMGAVEPGPGPQVQAIEQDGGSVIGSHFHDVAQFQVIVGGSGFIGRHRMTPGMLRYVDRHRVYGPVRADASGLVYLTLRAQHDPIGPLYMPESHDLLALRHPVDPRGLGFDCSALDTCWRDVGYEDADGLGVRALNLGRFQPLRIEMHGAGGFVVVVGGNLGRAFMHASCWLEAGDELEEVAGPHGARVLYLQFPQT